MAPSPIVRKEAHDVFQLCTDYTPTSCDFQELVEYVTGEESQSHTAYEVELTLFRQLLALGLQLLRLFFIQRASVRPNEPVYVPDGTRLKYHDLRQTTYFAVFGKVQFQRHYFHVSRHEGFCPLDAELSLPPHCYSDLLRDWAEYCITIEPYQRTPQEVVAALLPERYDDFAFALPYLGLFALDAICLFSFIVPCFR